MAAKKAISLTPLPNNEVLVTYDDGTTSKMTTEQARQLGLAGTPVKTGGPTGASASSQSLTPGAYGASVDTAFQDPITGGAVAGAGTVPTKGGPKTVAELVLQARNPKNLSVIKSLLLDAGLISKGTKSISSIQNTWLQVVIGAQSSQMDPEDYIKQLKAGGFGQDVAEEQLPGVYPTISSETQAQSEINRAFQSQLGRDATSEEMAKFIPVLQKAQKENPTKQTYKKVNGKRVQTTIQGLDAQQFLKNELQKLPEFSQKKVEATKLVRQDLAKTAAANGFNLDKDFAGQVDGWIKQIENGTDIDTIKNIIRQNAKLGAPDNVKSLLDQGVDLETVYAPYKRTMAAILEINPESLTLNDPVLRSAIGPDKEMTIYDFQRQLRKDPRWQYTNNARQEVSNAAFRVLQDFGFQR